MAVAVNNRAGQCLIALPAIQSGFFARSVVYLYEDSPLGTVGIALHSASALVLNDLAHHCDLPKTEQGRSLIYRGGPVTPMSVYLLHHRDYHTSNTVETGTGYNVTSDLTTISSLLHGVVTVPHRLFIGTSVWAPGQLDFEFNKRFWFSTELPLEDLLVLPGESVYDQAMAMAGKVLWDQWI